MDTTAPTFDQTPENQTVEYGDAYTYQINATDETAISTWWINDTNFTINNTGYLTNNTNLSIEIYTLNVSVNATLNTINS